nr:hypothetical protein [uncultured Roseateles sp.]
MTTIREAIWKLRADPFYPEVDRQGAPIPKPAVEKDLNPLLDERVLPLYFDVYDWSASDLVGELSVQDALARFPTPRSLPGSGLMVLISGSRETGLDSLANLLLHKIRLTTGGQAPMLIDIELEGRDKASNVAAVARRIIDQVEFGLPALPGREALAASMQAKYDRVSKAQEGRRDASYAEVFRAFRDLLKPHGVQLVVKIEKGGDHDSWISILESVRSCCAYVIVTTAEFAFAKTCYDAMIGNSLNVAWVKAQALDRTKAQQYLTHRLAAERLVPMADALDQALLPFTADALAVLYEPGAKSLPGKPVEHSVGWLRRTLYAALAEHSAALGQRHAGASDDELAGVDPRTTLLGRAEVIRARDKLNGKV